MTILPKVVLFDLDGTLIDSSEIVVDAYYNSLIEYNYPIKSRDFIAKLAGKSTFETARSMGIEEEDVRLIDQYFWDYFGNYSRDLDTKPVLFEGTTEFIEYLHKQDISLGLVTSNEASSAKILLEKAGLRQYFNAIVGKEDTEEKKPSAQPIEKVLERMNFSRQNQNHHEVWFIGDTKYDIEAAKNASIISVAIPQEHTYNTVIEAEPDYLVNSMKDLYQFFCEIVESESSSSRNLE